MTETRAPQAVQTDVLIDAKTLQSLLQSGSQDIVILDVRLGDEALASYLAGHIPGAVHVDLATGFAGRQSGFSGKRPLPDPTDLTRDAQTWGINPDSLIVLYDDNGNRQAARGWWTLRWAGAARVRLLDGGLKAWIAEGGTLATDVPQPARGSVVFEGGKLPVLDADGAAARPDGGILIDARGRDAYRGDDGGGHIPGAVSLPTSENLDPLTGRFRAPADLRKRFQTAGVEPGQRIGVYCGGGVAASHEIAALTLAGYSADLFPGSWSAWSSDPDRPVATGDKPR